MDSGIHGAYCQKKQKNRKNIIAPFYETFTQIYESSMMSNTQREGELMRTWEKTTA